MRAIFLCFTFVLSAIVNTASASPFGVTLRYWDMLQHNPQGSGIEIEDAQHESPGLTLRWSPDFWSNHDVLLSYFQIDPVHDAIIPGPTAAEIVTERDDIELLIRSRPNEKFSIFYGYRAIEADVITKISGTPVFQFTQKVKMLEFGLGMANAVSEDGLHTLFANAIYGLGRLINEGNPDELSADSFDLNFGYQYTINRNMAVSARYRTWTSSADGDLFLSANGVDIGLTYNF